jgi:hypothetical protein
MSIIHNQPRIAKFLIDAGADPLIENDMGVYVSEAIVVLTLLTFFKFCLTRSNFKDSQPDQGLS